MVDRFLADATEVDVDAISDGKRVVIGGIMEHIEQAGVHSGDSACAIPPYSLTKTVIDKIHYMKEKTGATSMILHFPPYYSREQTRRTIELFAEQVIPKFR